MKLRSVTAQGRLSRGAALLAAGIVAAVAATPASAQNLPVQAAAILSVEVDPAGARTAALALAFLIAEALQNNPELRGAAKESEAAGQRIRPAGALEDPMLEAGLLNVPIQPWRLNREDMTMKMLGISQKLPYPGKRALREQLAAKDAESAGYGLRETANRIARDVKLAYFDLALTEETIRQLQSNRLILEQFLRIAEGRYAVGQATQAEVLKAQIQLSRMSEELLRMERERPVMEAELLRLLGRRGNAAPIAAELPLIGDVAFSLEALQEAALRERPQLLGLQSVIDRSAKALELVRKEAEPDFDLRFAYGQREKDLAGMPREDVVSFTVAMNLPVWRKDKIEPRIAEAQAMREQTLEVQRAQQNEVLAKLRQQVAIAEQSRKSVRLYETGILPQAKLAVEASLSGYKVNRVDPLMLLDSQMTLFNYEISRAKELVNFNKALAEIELLTGRRTHSGAQ
jgi:outer membrane protein TolC